MKPIVSIITVNYNSLFDTMDLLYSLDRLSMDNLEIIVVDNASAYNPEQEIKATFPNVKVIVSEKNLGFAGGNNLGIKAASGNYLFFLNNDTVLVEDIITPMVDLMAYNPEIGMLSPKIKYFDDHDEVQYAGFTEVNSLTGRNRLLTTPKETNMPYDTAYPHGAAMLMRRSTVDQVGLMPEDYFLYYEELDWAAQVKQAGFKVFVDPRFEVYHKESASVGNESPLKTFYHTRNRLLFMKRHSEGLSHVVFLIYFFLVALPKAVLKFGVRGQYDHLQAFMRGLWLFRLPSFDRTEQVVPHPIGSNVLSPVS